VEVVSDACELGGSRGLELGGFIISATSRSDRYVTNHESKLYLVLPHSLQYCSGFQRVETCAPFMPHAMPRLGASCRTLCCHEGGGALNRASVEFHCIFAHDCTWYIQQ
jgi:hypothetical protein